MPGQERISIYALFEWFQINTLVKELEKTLWLKQMNRMQDFLSYD